jgi:hypothetical protein
VRLLGEEAWKDFAHSYIMAHPSSSFTIARAGDSIPGHIESAKWQHLPHWVHEVAVLEVSLLLATVAAPEEAFNLELLSALDAEQAQNIRLKLSASTHLLELEWNSADLINDEDCAPSKSINHALIYREGYRAKVETISAEEFEFLSLVSQHNSLGEITDLIADEAWLGWLAQRARQGVIALQDLSLAKL